MKKYTVVFYFKGYVEGQEVDIQAESGVIAFIRACNLFREMDSLKRNPDDAIYSTITIMG